MDNRDPDQSHNTPSLLPTKVESPTKYITPVPIPGAAGGGGGDRLKRDEWSEGAVSTLLEAYESKWVLRNRAKLKGHDWEDVARFVSSRASCTKSPKTQTQCKNKIESMKKRYRSESAAPDPSSWPLYPRLDMLLRGTTTTTQQPPATTNPPMVLLEPLPTPPPLPPSPPPLPPALPHLAPPPPGTAQNSHGSNGVDIRVAANKGQQEDGVGIKGSDRVAAEENPVETDSSTPALYSQENEDVIVKSAKKLKMARRNSKNMNKKKRRTMGSGGGSGSGYGGEIGESIRWLAEAIVRSEESRMETMKEVERMRIEAEAKRGEMDLKRTEIIANTQLEIARLLAGAGASGNGAGKLGIDSSLRIGRN